VLWFAARVPPIRPLLLAAALAACSPGGGNNDPVTPNTGAGLPPELLFCRSRTDSPQANSDIVLRTAQNLGAARAPSSLGREYHVRRHVDGTHLVFARELLTANQNSREIFVGSIDGSSGDLRLTNDSFADDGPCWSPAGDSILFSSARAGARSLHLMLGSGLGLHQFLAPPPGDEDREPDWSAATDRIVFRRVGGSGTGLWLVNGDGTGLVPLTAGADSMPAFAPDGSKVAFVRSLGTTAAALCSVDVATGTVTPLFAPGGLVAFPRWSPTADRLFCGIDQPAAGRAGLRLSVLRADGSDPLLVSPDMRWQLDGLDVLPAMTPAPAAGAPIAVDVTRADLQISAGTRVLGTGQQLAAADGQELVVATMAFNGREVAGVNLRFQLPVAAADDVLALRLEVQMRASRADGDSMLRISLYDPVEGRYDVVGELAPGGTNLRTLGVATQSLAHVTLERQVQCHLIADLAVGNGAELAIDSVSLVVVPRVH
jgi:hypothetical protein